MRPGAHDPSIIEARDDKQSREQAQRFGAFVDLGVHQDGLVHISELANEYVQSPSDIVSVGDVVRVKVLEVDLQRRRIALSLKEA